jgi:hypothetical protein
MNSMSVREGQKRIRNIAKTLSNDEELLVVDRQFLINALQNIANGDDAETELGVKAKKGERKGKHAKDVKITMQYIHGWIATAIAPEAEEGLGLTLKDAVAHLKKNWPTNLPAEATIIRYWNNVRKTQGRDFKIKTD